MSGSVASSLSTSPAETSMMSRALGRGSLDGAQDSCCEKACCRPRSRVMHVPCKGSTMVVPITSRGSPKEQQGLAAWFRHTGKIVTAPIELTDEDVRIVSSARQSRVRDSLLV